MKDLKNYLESELEKLKKEKEHVLDKMEYSENGYYREEYLKIISKYDTVLDVLYKIKEIEKSEE